MTMTRRRWLGTLSVCAAASSAALIAQADEPALSATSSASAVASASASSAPTTPVRDLGQQPPTGVSDHPKPGEWKDAEPVALARELPTSCDARLRREWLRIRCNAWNPQSGAVLTGDTENVFFFMVSGQTRMMNNPGGDASGYITLELPLRRGDRRLIQLTESDSMNYGGLGPQRVTALISVRWLDDEPGPTVTVGGS